MNKFSRILTTAIALAAMFTAVGCGTAKVTNQTQLSSMPMTKPTTIYVTDFDLDSANIKHKKGFLPTPADLGAPPLPLPGMSKSPEERATQLVELMSATLIKDLRKAGFNATGLAKGAPLPKQGWLVRGVFTEVQEGNRMQRAMIGFGQGKTDLQVVTTADDLSDGTPEPLYKIETDANSGKSPGAAPTLVLGPYGAAARFVMAGKDLDRNVKQTAGKIAEAIAKKVQSTNAPVTVQQVAK